MSDSATVRPDTSDMFAVHEVFRSSLASGPDLIGCAAGDGERRALIASYFTNVMEFLEVHHDGEESIVFSCLIDRAPDRRAIVDRAKEQHDGVVSLMAAVSESITSWAEEGDAKAPAVVPSLQALEDALIPHLDQEESEIVPLAGEYLTVEEWGNIPGHAMGNFGGDKIWLIIGLIRENFTQQQRDMMLEHMPPPAREMWETMGEASFNDFMADVRQSV